MQSVIDRTLLKANKAADSAFKNGVITVINFVTSLRDVISDMLQVNPAAAIAWSGICAILPVRHAPLLAATCHARLLNKRRAIA